MKILVCGDPHGGYWIRRCLQVADREGCCHAIFVGDVWDVAGDYREFVARPIAIAGNHEQPLQWEAGLTMGVCLPEYHRFEIGGVKFGSIGKIDQTNHEHLKTSIPWLYDALGPKPDIWMDKRPIPEVAELFKGIDILLTHDGPYPMRFRDPEGNEQLSGSAYLSMLIDAIKPRYAFHGHYHHHYPRHIGDTLVVGLDQQMRKRVPLSMIVLDTETMGYEYVPHLRSDQDA